jgi:hypothetical protein
VKVLCPACERMVDLERFRLEGSVLVVTCGRCQVDSRVAPPEFSQAETRQVALPVPAGSTPSGGSGKVTLVSVPGASNVVTLRTAASEAIATAAQSLSQAFEVPAGLCPKCIAPRKGDGASCPSCGLVFAQLNRESLEPPEWLKVMWLDLLKDWGNETKHDQTRRAASQQGGLPDLGRLYRLRQALSAADPWAEKGREEVLRLATAGVSLRPPTSPADEQPSRTKVLVAAGILALTLGAMGYLLTVLLKSQN